MKRMIGGLLVVALLGAGVAATTPMGAPVRAWDAGAYQTGYVALAWPVASVLGDLDRVPRAIGQGRPVPSLVIPWRTWIRYGVDWRWRTLQANRTQGRAIRQGMLYGYGGLGLLLTLLLGVPLARLAQRGRRIKPVGAGGTARWATWRDLRRHRARRGQARVMLGRLGGRVVLLRVGRGDGREVEHVEGSDTALVALAEGAIVPRQRCPFLVRWRAFDLLPTQP